MSIVGTCTVFFGPSVSHLEIGLREELRPCGNFDYVTVAATRFPDGETCVNLGPSTIDGPAVIVQGTHPPQDEHLQQLYQMVDVARRKRAQSIVCVLPYFGYGRQDKAFDPGEPITAELILRILKALGCSAVVTIDMHNPAAGKHIGLPLLDLRAAPLLGQACPNRCWDDVLWLSPDAGGAGRVDAVARALGGESVILKKERISGTIRYHGDLAATKHRDVMIVDDICATGSTLQPLLDALDEAGVWRVGFFATHFLADAEAIQKRRRGTVAIYGANTVPSNPPTVRVERLLAREIQKALLQS